MEDLSRDGLAQSKVIEFLRFPMACAVVMIHSAACKNGYTESLSQFLSIFFAEGVCRLAVPSFFLISGYLFFSNLTDWNPTIWGKKIKKRVRSLFVPYVLWNCLAFVFISLYSAFRLSRVGGDPSSLRQAFVNYGGFRLFWDCDSGMPIDFPLWFIRDLMFFVLLTPLMFYLIRRFKGYGFAILGISYILSFLNEGFFFFFAGSFLRINQRSILETIKPYTRYACVSAPFFLLCSVLMIYFHKVSVVYDIVNRLWIISGVTALFYHTSHIVDRAPAVPVDFLARSSFFIFASHGILILYDFANFITIHLIPWKNEFCNCVYLFLRPSIAILICIVTYFVMSRLLPKTTRLLTGSRG